MTRTQIALLGAVSAVLVANPVLADEKLKDDQYSLGRMSAKIISLPGEHHQQFGRIVINTVIDNNTYNLSQSAQQTKLNLSVTGGSNKIDTNQSGLGATGTITVVGNSNAINLSQSATATKATITIAGNSNNVDISQSGIGSTANLDLCAMGSTVRMTQASAKAFFAYAGTIPPGGTMVVTQ